MKKNKWSVLYLGPNISNEEIFAVSSMKRIEYIYLHLITNFTGMHTDEYLESICSAFPDKKIIASGEGIRNPERSFMNLQRLDSDQQIYSFIQRTI